MPPHSPPDSFTKRSVSSNDPNNTSNQDPSALDGDETQYAYPAMARSSSEEKDPKAPAPSKRKEQNRAAYVDDHQKTPEMAFGENLTGSECDINVGDLVSEHSASEKSAASKTSRTK